MKKSVLKLGVLSFATIFVMLACETKKPEGLGSSVTQPVKEATEVNEVPVQAKPERGFIPLSQLAFKGYLANPRAQMPEVKALYSAAQKDARDVAEVSKSKDEKANQQTFVMMKKAVDLCPCSTGSGLCPCPGDTTDIAFVARAQSKAEVTYDEKPLKAKASEDGDGSWVVYSWPAELKDGKHKLSITGKFTSTKQRYDVPVEVKDGKFYLNLE